MATSELRQSWEAVKINLFDPSTQHDQKFLIAYGNFLLKLESAVATLSGCMEAMDYLLKENTFERIFEWNSDPGFTSQSYKSQQIKMYSILVAFMPVTYFSYNNFCYPFAATMYYLFSKLQVSVEADFLSLLASLVTRLTSPSSPDHDNLKSSLLFRILILGGSYQLPRTITSVNQFNQSWELEENDLDMVSLNINSNNAENGASYSSSEIFDDFEHETLFDILLSFFLRCGRIGWQARDIFIFLLSNLSLDQLVSAKLSQHSSFPHNIATFLASTFISLVKTVTITKTACDKTDFGNPLKSIAYDSDFFNDFLEFFKFVRTIADVSHPLLLNCIMTEVQSEFFELVFIKYLFSVSFLLFVNEQTSPIILIER
ncbi:hypothetical protein Ciccas_011172 [Cichlidogyrus casuarinus]|uniref:Uncharacterized protein n=1 Tax=Cichlidogyrus casuarinus TaxID=1844966 RepID=A0ABD2PS26_9PLAT